LNGKSSIIRSSREGASPAESVPGKRDVKCVRELVKGSLVSLPGKQPLSVVKVELRQAIQLEWNRGLTVSCFQEAVFYLRE